VNKFFKSIRRIFARRMTNPQPGRRFGVKARFDSTVTDFENKNHWAAADSLGPNTANSTDVRNTLCRRARLERENDPHVFGMTQIAAYNFVGTGPRLQLTLDTNLYEQTRKYEQLFTKWARAINLAEKLRLMIEACPVDGETFGQLITNPFVDHPVKVDIKVMEQEQVATPGFAYLRINQLVDGLEIDQYGNVTAYHVLKEHPGDAITWTMDYDTVPSRFMLHWFRAYRPGQERGVSAFASTLETCAVTRRYTKATLAKQEINANITGVIETDNVMAETGDAPTFATMEEIDIPRRGLMTMPAGMTAKPFSSAENTADYKQFVASNHATVGRPIHLPRNLITGDSSDFNFASGRMDHLPYQSVVWIDRERARNRLLDKIHRVFYAAAKDANLVPAGLPPLRDWTMEWQWDGFPSIDQVKDTTAQENRLRLGLTTLAEECAAEGRDWRDVVRQRAIERKYLIKNGLDPDMGMGKPAPVVAPKPAANNDPNADQNDPNFGASDEDTTLDLPNYGRYARV